MENNSETKRCYRCGKVKPITDFGVNVSRKDGLNDECRKCRRKKYQELHGGLQHALRRFSDDELIGEMIRRKAAYDLLDCIASEDIAGYLRSVGYSVMKPADQTETKERGEA